MKQGEYFRINSIEELKQAYEMFEGEWDKTYSLEVEIKDFNKGYKYVLYSTFGIYLADVTFILNYTEIPSPLRNINNLNKLI